eukprot:g4611.t1
MMGIWLSKSVSNFVGYAYPAYATYKVLRDNEKEKHPEWLMYWAVMSCFTALEIFGDTFVSWLPFYYEAKILFIFWLVLPQFKGAITLYRKVLHPTIQKYEDDIDKHIDNLNTEAIRHGSNVGQLGLAALREHSVSLLQMGQSAITAATVATLQSQKGDEVKAKKKRRKKSRED